jgi:hypothetical protein
MNPAASRTRVAVWTTWKGDGEASTKSTSPSTAASVSRCVGTPPL